MLTDPICQIYLNEKETPRHVLWSCPEAIVVWLVAFTKHWKNLLLLILEDLLEFFSNFQHD